MLIRVSWWPPLSFCGGRVVVGFAQSFSCSSYLQCWGCVVLSCSWGCDNNISPTPEFYQLLLMLWLLRYCCRCSKTPVQKGLPVDKFLALSLFSIGLWFMQSNFHVRLSLHFGNMKIIKSFNRTKDPIVISRNSKEQNVVLNFFFINFECSHRYIAS